MSASYLVLEAIICQLEKRYTGSCTKKIRSVEDRNETAGSSLLPMRRQRKNREELFTLFGLLSNEHASYRLGIKTVS